jgi:purine-binding chemotaxis protein CheW
MTPNAVQPPAGEPARLTGYGGFWIGAMQLALPLTALREVVPCLGLADLPCPAACVIGGINLRGVLVPVVDLRIVFGRERGSSHAASVIIMAHDGHLLGLLADGITGIFAHENGSDSDARYGVGGAGPGGQAECLYAGSVRRADTAELVSVLSAAALARLPQVPMTSDPAPQRLLAESAVIDLAHGSERLPVMLMRCGRIALAIDALAVQATLSDPKIHPSVLAQGECRGVIDYAGQRIAVVDLLALCGLGRLQGDNLMQVFVMKFDTGYVGLLVDAVLDVVSVSRQQVFAVPAFALQRPGLFLGALPPGIMPPSAVAAAGTAAIHEPLPQFLLLDAAALQAAPELLGLSQTNTPSTEAASTLLPAANGHSPRVAAGAAAETAAATTAGKSGEMITYELFSEEASPIGQVTEILRYDPSTAVFEQRGAFLGLMIDRGRSIPVMCLRRLAGVEPVPLDGTSSVLVVKSEGDWVGFAVPRLLAIETAQWSPTLPQRGMGENDALAQVLGSREMVQVNTDRGTRMLRVLDLCGIARSLREQSMAA